MIAGVDEAGRGPLAGPVIAAAVILDAERPITGLNDSKKLSEAARERLAAEIWGRARAVSIGRSDPDEIDELNILWATMRAMERAVAGLAVRPDRCLIDGNRCPAELAMPAQAIVGGDATEPAISAASIIAKTTRDAELRALAQDYPQYGFEQHKGYPTAMHRARLREHGPCPAHRRSLGPVRQALAIRSPS